MANFSATSSASRLNAFRRSSSAAASEGSCSAARKELPLSPKVSEPSSKGDSITMPATDALLAFERARHLGGAEAAVAFAQQIFRRAGAIVVIDIERD